MVGEFVKISGKIENTENFPVKSFYNKNQNEIYTFYKEG